MTQPLRLKSLRASVYRAPIETPVTTSFGIMRNRPMVLVTAEDEDGACGWGEVWCNFPQVGAEHRARLVESVLAPLATARTFDGAEPLFRHLTATTEVLAIQSGEIGSFAQVIAGVDIAVWDLLARRQGLPLWRLAGGGSPTIRVYASGLNPTSPEVLARSKHAEGYRAFKLKVGFGAERDIANLDAMRRELGPSADVMVDANQGWSLADAIEIAPRLERFNLSWLEEPLRADQPWTAWRQLKSATSLPLAAGENIYGISAFNDALTAGVLSVVQPDMAKWGGFSGCRPVAAQIAAKGVTYCPHYLGGGVGLLASAHLLAAVRGPGRLEIDANANPLRTLLCGPLNDIREGSATLTDKPGLGIGADELSAIDRYRVPH
ncbi:mandelate racemase/muconate lactonizing enzyme family protein [Bradyrhizobium sp. LHD-71]|uniref:mandelate racemase/muconate lactonizing enzyme family protein n=1 Tax=Bradyrhizobium sp. LHD-71 TaxID=3072141 RepID=UPI00280C8161|nr:mandelate racemase/muconate lactonizing enzyme family protein [Bradyrhizobium sp. LHD-71]MDQ8727880.1 mandelate racemase/muconate lactonizing enzyme family protein [Bradyrhizobium sp. LHD-71]